MYDTWQFVMIERRIGMFKFLGSFTNADLL